MAAKPLLVDEDGITTVEYIGDCSTPVEWKDGGL